MSCAPGLPHKFKDKHMTDFSHIFDSTILRAYDIRGIIDKSLTAADAFAIGAGFAHITAHHCQKPHPKIAIGYDGRTTSPYLAEALCEGLMAKGAEVIMIGLGPTPMLYFADLTLDCDGAIQITGSHNPKEYNGFKMVLAHSAFYGEDIIALGSLVATGLTLTYGGSRRDENLFDDYINRLLQDVSQQDQRFVWDTGNGAAGPAVRALIDQMPGIHKLLFEQVDGTFPNHHPDPVDPKTLGFLRSACKDLGAFCGFGFDGDGDRLGMIDAKGRQVPGDMLTAFLAGEFLQRCPGETILFDVKSSSTAMSLVTKAGGKAELWKTGHSHMKSRMKEINCQLAGEMSGHIFIGDGYFGFDDALYVAVRVLKAMQATNQSITEFMDHLPISYTTPECRVACDDTKKFAIMDALASHAKTDLADKQAILIDGIRVQDKTGWWLVRASNTEACLVVRAEGISEPALSEKINELKTLLAKEAVIWDGP